MTPEHGDHCMKDRSEDWCFACRMRFELWYLRHYFDTPVTWQYRRWQYDSPSLTD